MLNVRIFRGDDSDTDHYLVVTKLRERLAVSKQAEEEFERDIFNLRKLNEVLVRESIILSYQRGL
jgi:hypothetical protein